MYVNTTYYTTAIIATRQTSTLINITNRVDCNPPERMMENNIIPNII